MQASYANVEISSVPATQIEEIVMTQIREMLMTPDMVFKTYQHARIQAIGVEIEQELAKGGSTTFRETFERTRRTYNKKAGPGEDWPKLR